MLLSTAAPDLRTPEPPPSEIVGGEPTASGEFDGVVAILTGGGLCTGTVVDTNLVLTAAHCLQGISNPSQISVSYGLDIDDGMSVGVTDFGAHPDFDPIGTDDIFDYGFVVISGDFTLPGGFLLPITDQAEWDATIGVGAAVTIVGYGEDPNAGGPDNGIGRKRKVLTSISKLSPIGFEFNAGGMSKDSCQGDSGGPAFVRLVSGKYRLAGITSRGSSPCGQGGFYGTPYPALDWVRDETGIDLCGADCPSCDCLDMTPPAEKEKCSVDPQGSRPSPWLLLLLIALPRRRR